MPTQVRRPRRPSAIVTTAPLWAALACAMGLPAHAAELTVEQLAQRLKAIEQRLGTAAPAGSEDGGNLADLDQRLRTHIDNSAEVVATGRRQLDAVRQWVSDAAASVPPGKQRDAMLMQIANKGISQVSDIVSRSTTQMNSIAGDIKGDAGKYQALGNQKFGGIKEGEGEALGAQGDKEQQDEARRRAEDDVQAALRGDEEAAGRVDQVLDSIQPGQPLTAEQGSYLSQMQAQQNGMSVDALKAAEQRLGDHKDIIADSWQLMSNKDVTFPKTELAVDALDDPSQPVNGGFDQLPRSVQDTLNAPDIQGGKNLQQISGIVRDGDDRFQTNTELDRAMLKKAAVMMDTPFWQQSAQEYDLPDDQRLKYLDPVVSDVFTAVSPDHHAVHDAITAGPGHIDGIDSDKFMKGVSERIWADDGKAAGELFEWTKDTHGPDAAIAAETAEAYGKYLGTHGPQLLDLPGHHSIGEVNPELVRAFGQGLAPYQQAMIGDTGTANGFQPLDSLSGDMHNTRNLFAVIDSDPEAAKQFNGQAFLKASQYETSFSSAAAQNPVIDGSDPRSNDLRMAGRLLGLVDAGADIETSTHNMNDQKSAFEQAKASWERKDAWYQTIAGNIPGGDRVAAALHDGFVGPEPQVGDFPPGSHTTDVGTHGDQRELGNATTQAQYTVAAAMITAPNADIPATYFRDGGAGPLMTPAEVRATYGESGWDDYSSKLHTYISKYPSLAGARTDFQFTYGGITGIGPQDMPR